MSSPLSRRVVLSVLMSAAVAGAWAQAPDWKKIRIGVEGAYPPFSEVGPDGQLKGFDIDIARALCAELKAECTLVQQDFDGMIPGLQARKFDAVVASMSITDERKKAVNFSNKYMNTPARFIGKAGVKLDISPAALKGKKIGVQRTTTHDRYLSANYKDSEIVRYTKQDEVFLDLLAGRVDLILCDSVAADFGFLKRPMGKGFAFVGSPVDDPAIFGAGAGIALRKADTALADKFNAAIASLRANGGYKKLQDKYFDFDVYGK
jgi:arginine/ornithine transport system substrate-binding protein